MFRPIALPQYLIRHGALGIEGLALVDGMYCLSHRQPVWNDAIERVSINRPTRRQRCGISTMPAILTLTTILFSVAQGLRMPIQQTYRRVGLALGLECGRVSVGHTADDTDLGASTPNWLKHRNDGFSNVGISKLDQINGITGDRVVDVKPIGIRHRSGWYRPSAIPSLT